VLKNSIALVVAAILIMGITSLTATARAQQGEIQTESDGDLTTTLNGESFQAGNTITVRGTVGERDIDSFVVIEIIDSEGETVESAYPDVTADNTWQQSFTPGQETNIYSKEWTASGNYRMTISYSVPGEGFEREELEFVFSYDANPTTVGSEIDNSEGTIYTSPDGFRLQVPSGWVIWDGDNTMPGAVSSEKSQGLGMLAELCPQTGAMPQIGGGYVCSPSEEQSRVSIFSYANLTSRPEFASIVSSGQNITISDFVALWIQQSTTEGQSVSRHEVTENEERTVNLFDAATNRTVEGITAPAQWVQLTVGQQSEGLFQTVEVTYSALLVLSPDGKTGYAIVPTGRYNGDDEGPAGTEEIVNSFELIAPSSITPTTPSTVSPPQQQQQQQPPSPPAPQLLL
jgi:hypothetical protein